jgi:hypothetical protein
MTTATIKTKAWVTQYSSTSPENLLAGDLRGLSYYESDMTSAGWTLVGDAEVTVTLIDKRTMIDNKIAALREEAKTVRAEATAKVTKIEGQIQNLLALSFDGEQA